MSYFKIKVVLFLVFVGLFIGAFNHRSGWIESDDGMIQSHFIELSASIPGQVSFFRPFHPGMEIEKGEPLFWIENHQYANQEPVAQYNNLKNLLNTLSADITCLGIELNFARRNVRRAQLLYASKTISVEELEERETECERISNLIAAKKQHRQELTTNLQETTGQLDRLKREEWRSPVNGTVWAIYAQPNEHQKDAVPLVALIDKSALYVDAYWSEKHLRQLKPGRMVEIKVIASGDRFQGTIASVRAGVGRVHFTNPEQQPAESYKKRVLVTRIRIAEDGIPFSSYEFYGVGVSVRARLQENHQE